MNNNVNYFRINYQDVKNILTVALFLLILYKAIDIVKNFPLPLNVNSTLDYFSLALFICFLIFGLWLISTLIVDAVYYVAFRNEKWYGEMKRMTITIPLTKNQCEQIKLNKKFFDTYPENKKHSFQFMKFEKWSEKILENEIKKLGREGK